MGVDFNLFGLFGFLVLFLGEVVLLLLRVWVVALAVCLEVNLIGESLI